MIFWFGIMQFLGLLVLVLVIVLGVLAIVRAVFVPADLRRAATCGGVRSFSSVMASPRLYKLTMDDAGKRLIRR